MAITKERICGLHYLGPFCESIYVGFEIGTHFLGMSTNFTNQHSGRFYFFHQGIEDQNIRGEGCVLQGEFY